VLQQQFNQEIFVREQEVYVSEGLDWSQISFHDNQGLIDLIGRRSNGLLAICEEHVMISYKRNANNQALLQQMDKTYAASSSGGDLTALPPGAGRPSMVARPSMVSRPSLASSAAASAPLRESEVGARVSGLGGLGAGGAAAAGDNDFYGKPRFNRDSEFIIRHFAGEVTYNINGFIEKNRDSLNEELREMLVMSSRPFLVCLFGEPLKRLPGMAGYLPDHGGGGGPGGGGLGSGPGGGLGGGPGVGAVALSKGKSAGANSVSLRFREQLEELTATLRSTQPHYIKCIKPNPVKAPGAVRVLASRGR
jgi:myosin-5